MPTKPASSMTVFREFFDRDVVVIVVDSIVVIAVDRVVPFVAVVFVASLPATLFMPDDRHKRLIYVSLQRHSYAFGSIMPLVLLLCLWPSYAFVSPLLCLWFSYYSFSYPKPMALLCLCLSYYAFVSPMPLGLLCLCLQRHSFGFPLRV